MAEPQLQVEERLDRIEMAISIMAQWLVQAQTGFNARDAEGIEKILRGESRGTEVRTPDASEESETEGMGVREQREELG
jgi:hypothetical protein